MDKHYDTLSQLARLYGLQTVYHEAGGQRRQASQQALLAALQALGAPVAGLSDVPGALRQGRLKKWQQCCEPVTVAWEDRFCYIELRLPAYHSSQRAQCRLELEQGDTREWTCDLALLPPVNAATLEGITYQIKHLPLPGKLPPGYHQCVISVPGLSCRTLLVSAPRHVYLPPGEAGKRVWGVFLPLYALRSEHSWAAGDFGDLEHLLHWTQSLGGGLVGTLPLLAAFLDQPFSPSPYSPASRLFWNEFFLNITAVPELKICPEARELLNAPDFQSEIAALRRAPLVDYRRGMAVKRRILELLAQCCARTPVREEALQSWVIKHPAVRDYARFRAAMEKQQATWQKWPERMRNGELQPGDYEPEAERYHTYVQWLAHEQLQALAGQANHRGPGLYLDLPLGVHRAGYDVWREGRAFARGAACGAPPDPLNTSGQNWEFPPLHPEGIREQGYRYYIASLRNHMRHAGILRLDHVMGLHRLFWIPAGMSARDGVYVKYRAEEFYAILALESHRMRTLLVGEDLGTVPAVVRTTMNRHKLYRMHILPFEIHRLPRRGPHLPPARSLAALNTHDMPPFAAYWQRENRRRRTGLSHFLYRKGWIKAPTASDREVLLGCLKHLAASRARVLLVNLEDLWLEKAPQNIPGTTTEYPNWRRKAAPDMEEFTRMPRVLKALRVINGLRKRKYHIPR
ncbi:4-alpha-glucanotransferase [Desulfallas thermosapovorans]|uniref:4-alpha-glucanotransferase n=1 Tax=Desulfallas thermosapovorans DSM 6562 TaxID=1121431 RepID=A0A5S4ZPI8_9FIRM|nr:4-alpha-glucanotransferase [Desulfallas thermosapovorans]TYO94718.1 4-alpha-glucanotransferase [Desulfallas thermosapovorans DSM 6562]